MHPSLLDILVCPDCAGEARLDLVIEEQNGPDIQTGRLTCSSCCQSFPIVRGVPRMVADEDNYSENFAYEWNLWGRVQIDRFAGHSLSAQRFLADSRWPEAWLNDKLVLDAGCGAGRFADVAAGLGARVVAIDLSGAVDAARANTIDRGSRVEVVQASLFRLPFRRGVFDGIYCMGVIQHTPDPEAVMSALPAFSRPGGRLAYNFYEIDWRTRLQPIKYALRAFTPRLGTAVNHYLALALTLILFPLSWLLSHVRFVRFINSVLPICATHSRELTFRQQFVWTLLDTFDWYSPRYEIRQSHAQVATILRCAGLANVTSAPGLAWGQKPPAAPIRNAKEDGR
jgi:2-polyprenyl-3-methyl-5-hydroxy-6-metoxy-1,4-benzoquinol methylase